MGLHFAEGLVLMHRGCICVYVYMLMYLFMTSFIHQRIDWSVLDIHMPMSFHRANSTSSPPLSNPSSPPLCPPLSFPRLPLPLRPGQYLIRARKRDGILSSLSTNLLTSSPDCPVSAPLLPFSRPFPRRGGALTSSSLLAAAVCVVGVGVGI